jgi:hypothetical protein
LSLNEQATVSFNFARILPQGGHSCLSRAHENVRRESCKTAAAGSLSFTGHGGTNNVSFTGRISRTIKLKPGQYELVITATNSAGQSSVPVSLSFTIVK